MGRFHLSIIGFLLMISASMTVLGNMPRTVNQHLGMPDTQFSNSDTQECKRCHKPQDIDPVNYPDLQKPTGIPMLKGTYLPTRHHLHVDMGRDNNVLRDGLIAGGSEQPPLMDADGDGVIDTKYTCENCHIKMPINEWGGVEENHRVCSNCHIVENDERTVHHDTPKAKEGKCDSCHGYLVRSLDTGMPPPIWSPSLLVPWASGKPNADFSITSPSGTHPGNCDFCHNVEDPSFDELSPSNMGPITVFSNKETHHATGVPTITDSSKGPTCNWCHNYDRPAEEGIRVCQRCHDIPSLHSIQADLVGDGIVPLQELPFGGHIGSAVDCWGCHGFSFDPSIATGPWGMPFAQSMSTRNLGTEATIPQLESINALIWPEGTPFEMTLAGSGFINQGGLENGVTYRPMVQLTDSSGGVTVLTPVAESVNSVQVAIPATLTAGSYTVQIKKDDKLSNPIEATIIPAINVLPGAAICLTDYRVVIVRGEGFTRLESGMPSSVIGITSSDGTAANRVFLWRDGMIAARFNAGCPSLVQVNTLFDSKELAPTPW